MSDVAPRSTGSSGSAGRSDLLGVHPARKSRGRVVDAPAHAEPTCEANARLVVLGEAEGARMAHLRLPSSGLSRRALDTITGCVTSPSQMARMVTIGHVLAE